MPKLNGIDCSTRLNASSISKLKSEGIKYIGRYLGDSWKSIDREEAKTIIDEGLSIVSIWETNPTYADYFTKAKGISDAQNAYSFAQSLGQPTGSAIFFAVDFDAQGDALTAISEYFSGVKVGLKGSYKIGVYGSYTVLNHLYSEKACDFYWQTTSWSRGQQAKFISILQYSQDRTLAGVSVDYNEVLDGKGAWRKTPASSGSGTRSSSSTAQPSKESTKEPSKKSSKATPTTYVVKQGDTLNAIAAKFGTTVQKLVKLNGIENPDLIYVGQKIKLKATKTSSSKAGSSEPSYYTVKKGDTLSKIAAEFHTTIKELMALNSIQNPDYIQAGQKLKLPGSKANTDSPKYYTVEKGDTLSGIAATYHTTIQQLMSWNHLQDPDLIKVGERLRVK
ncbi:LysM peptidoglycan-binding domain-containing protein [Pullulanibacillus sp. KACC 23026]|uniref:LysM peptidoglycan-binding domain-containing protein n=1 Tax=Pullulanibacillus sp. KACC 23026 TaxID=3028315 RepID=UPI0023B127C5|nr:LysM peptidoglycan-binding domain-containing protein [Pullulanibacillus sp. KACC 23026]WEG12906.1 LysM peptidoglycan-binding domain-containing protein [Pullulanibacillus sp. KACC 23026]